MAETHVFRIWCDEPPGPTYLSYVFNGNDKWLRSHIYRFAGELPKYWKWEITAVATMEEFTNAVAAHSVIREANSRAYE